MASTVTELLRRRFGGKSEPPYLDGWTYYESLTTNGKTQSAATTMVSPFIDKGTASSSITLTKGFRWCWYDANYNFIDYWSMNGATNTRTAGANVRYIRVCFYIADIDNSYVKDNTNNVYLFKGKNI